MSNIDGPRMVSLMKLCSWEDAKAALRKVAALSGSLYQAEMPDDSWEEVGKAVEDFISKFEEHGHHE